MAGTKGTTKLLVSCFFFSMIILFIFYITAWTIFEDARVADVVLRIAGYSLVIATIIWVAPKEK